MTYLELCQKVFDLADRAPYSITTVQVEPEDDEQIYKIARWVRQAYEDIQGWSRYFAFHHQSGVLFETTADGTKDYSVTNVRKIWRDSLHARVKANPTDDWDLIFLSYQQWRDMFITVQLNDGRPIYFTELPNGSFRIEPGADAVYEILADYTVRKDRFEQDEDVPLFHEDYHDLIVFQALRYYSNEYEVPEEVEADIRIAFPSLKSQFLLEYLPDLEIAGGQV